MSRITQGKVSSGLSEELKTRFMKKYNLVPLTDNSKPVFFFGIYSLNDIDMINNHKSLAVLIWGGNDIVKIKTDENRKKYCKNILNKSNVKHISISSDISKDLIDLGYIQNRIKFSLADISKYNVCSLGTNIYIYTNVNCPERYGKKYYKEIKKRLPNIKFIIANYNTYTQIQLIKIYQSCFIGLRLTDHDGNANTVQELGLCGIRCVHNSDMPNAIPWKTVDDIIKTIKKERVRIGKTFPEVAQQMKQFLQDDKKWLHSSYYKYIAPVIPKIKEPLKISLTMIPIENTKQNIIVKSPEKVILSNEPMSVSIIMNVYNEDDNYLTDAINSYLNQEDVKIQLIISTVEDDPCINYIGRKWKDERICFSICDKNKHPGRGHLGIYYQINEATI